MSREPLVPDEAWKTEVDVALDAAVLTNFERLYHPQGRANYDEIWSGISRELHGRYGLLGTTSSDSDFLSKLGKRSYLSKSIELYAEEEFLEYWMETGDRSLKFVKQFGKLPKQLPHEWRTFELGDRVKQISKERAETDSFRTYLRQHAAVNPDYAHR